MARGSVVDEPALIKALQQGTILSAGLDVYAREPHVPPELIAMDKVVLFPHLGSASVTTRQRMDQLVVDNLLAWAAGKHPAAYASPQVVTLAGREQLLVFDADGLGGYDPSNGAELWRFPWQATCCTATSRRLKRRTA